MVLCAPVPSVLTTANLPIFMPAMLAPSHGGCQTGSILATAGRKHKGKAAMPPVADLEGLTQDYGRAIFARLHAGGPAPFTPSWLDERMMEWTMGDPTLKVNLFRFVDALPRLDKPDQ